MFCIKNTWVSLSCLFPASSSLPGWHYISNEGSMTFISLSQEGEPALSFFWMFEKKFFWFFFFLLYALSLDGERLLFDHIVEFVFCAGPGRGPGGWLVSSIWPPLLLWGLKITFTPSVPHPQCGFFKRNRPPLEESDEEEEWRCSPHISVPAERLHVVTALSLFSSQCPASSARPWIGAVPWRPPDVLLLPSELAHPPSCCLIKRLNPSS